MKRCRLYLLFFLGTLLMISSCRQERPHIVDPWSATTLDSVAFKRTHHYWKNFYFLIVDSLQLENTSPDAFGYLSNSDSTLLTQGDVVVVLNLTKGSSESEDDIWAMVAKDEETLGWVKESELRKSAIPDNPISRFIHTFSNHRLSLLFFIVGSAFLLWGIQRSRKDHSFIIHFNDVKSFYPTLLCVIVSGSAVLYGAFQQFLPGMWEHFYYHPTLNLFEPNPLLLRLFLMSIWLILIVGIAVLDDLRKQLPLVASVSYLSSLLSICMLLYLFFTWSVHLYIGYPLLLFYWGFAFRQHFRHNIASYKCGNCGATLREKGECPDCKAFNN